MGFQGFATYPNFKILGFQGLATIKILRSWVSRVSLHIKILSSCVSRVLRHVIILRSWVSRIPRQKGRARSKIHQGPRPWTQQTLDLGSFWDLGTSLVPILREQFAKKKTQEAFAPRGARVDPRTAAAAWVSKQATC